MTDNFGNDSSNLYDFAGYEVDDVDMVESSSFSTTKRVGKPLQGSVGDHSDYPFARISIRPTFRFACPPRRTWIRQPYRTSSGMFRSRPTTEAKLQEKYAAG